MQETSYKLVRDSGRQSGGIVCFYCGLQIDTGEEIINRGESKFYHRKCFNRLFTMTSKRLMEAQKRRKVRASDDPWYFTHI